MLDASKKTQEKEKTIGRWKTPNGTKISNEKVTRSSKRCHNKRKTGRGSKTARYRHQCRKNGWLPPSVYHRVQSLRRWTQWLLRFCRPIACGVRICVEVNAFNLHKAVNPEVAGVGYQQGALWRANLRGYVLTRDGSRCVYCEGKGKFELDHVIAKRTGDSDRHWNRATACSDCNASKDEATLEKWLVGCAPAKVKRRKRKIAAYTENVASRRVKLSAMAATTVVGPCLVKKLQCEELAVEENSGAETGAWRRITKVEKSHAMDAACTATKGQPWVLDAPARRCAQDRSLGRTLRGEVPRRNQKKRDGFKGRTHSPRVRGPGTMRHHAPRAPNG